MLLWAVKMPMQIDLHLIHCSDTRHLLAILHPKQYKTISYDAKISTFSHGEAAPQGVWSHTGRLGDEVGCWAQFCAQS